MIGLFESPDAFASGRAGFAGMDDPNNAFCLFLQRTNGRLRWLLVECLRAKKPSMSSELFDTPDIAGHGRWAQNLCARKATVLYRLKQFADSLEYKPVWPREKRAGD